VRSPDVQEQQPAGTSRPTFTSTASASQTSSFVGNTSSRGKNKTASRETKVLDQLLNGAVKVTCSAGSCLW
jgi:hypothetical protein